MLFSAGLGVPLPEELPIVAAAVLAHVRITMWWTTLAVCIAGVLSGDVALYWVGHHWGERILEWRVVRWVLSRPREEALKARYRRHAIKTVFVARHVAGLRAAAFLTAGIAHVPFWEFFAVDAIASLISVPLSFGLAYFFTDQLEAVLADVHRVERWLVLALLAAGAAWFGVAAWRRNRRLARDRHHFAERDHRRSA